MPHPSPFLLLDWNVDTIPDSVIMIMKQQAGILNQPDEELIRKVEGNWQTVASRKCGKFRKGPGLTVRGDAT